MNFHEYAMISGATDRDLGLFNMNLFHAMTGITSELHELINDKGDENFLEEVGDICWYLAKMYRTLNLTEEKFYKEYLMILHGGALVIAVSQLADTVKRWIVYEEINDNIIKSMAIVLTSLAESCDKRLPKVNGLEIAWKQNIDKLMKRYPDNFNVADAIARKDK